MKSQIGLSEGLNNQNFHKSLIYDQLYKDVTRLKTLEVSLFMKVSKYKNFANNCTSTVTISH